MKLIKVNKSELLGHLRTNREVHVEEYNNALIAYRGALIKAFKEALKKANNLEDVNHRVDVIRPLNYLESYDNVISMLEWTTEDTIELDQNEFRQYVQDAWGWKNEFTAVAASYAKH